MKNKKNICIFGHLDSEAGQLFNLLSTKDKIKVKFFVCFGKLPKINVVLEHNKRPNKKTSFARNGKILGKRVYDYSDYLKAIKKFNIKECFIAESNIKKRAEIYKIVKRMKIKIRKFIHSSVVFGDRQKSNIGEGTILYPKNYIGYKTDLGKCCIIQSGCSIDHHNKIDDFCNLNPGIFTGGFTKINKFSEIHIRSTIINRIKIGKNCRIGAGSLVLKNVPNNTLVYGRPAKKIRKNLS